MSKRSTLACDICGVTDNPGNRVSVRVSMIVDEPKEPQSFFSFVAPEPRADIDMCVTCASGMLDIVRAARGTRERETRAKRAAADQSQLGAVSWLNAFKSLGD